MQTLSRPGPGRFRLRLRASHRLAPLRISHGGPASRTWTPPSKDRDDDAPAQRQVKGGNKGKSKKKGK